MQEIPEMGVPDKITTTTLPSLGYKSTNDRCLPPILKFIGFLDANGVPTERYKNFRNKQVSKSVMADAIKTAYADLFKLYPDAYNKDFTNLRDFFSGTTKAGDKALKLTVESFKALCDFADFKGAPVVVEDKKNKETQAIPQIPAGVTINLNIQLTLPATSDATVYDKIFKALRENLLTRD